MDKKTIPAVQGVAMDSPAQSVSVPATDGGKEPKKPKRKIVRLKGGMDAFFLIIIITLLCLGTIMIFSASYAYAKQYLGDTYYYLKKQILFVLLGLLVMFFCSRIDYMFIEKYAYVFFALVMVLMIATAIPGVGTAHHGARRWLELGPISFQPSELMKLAVILAFAKYTCNMREKMKQFKYGIMIPMAVIVLIDAIMYLQSHMSGMIILTLIALVMMFLGGCSIGWLAAFGAIGGAGAAAIFITGYRSDRIAAWLHPFEHAKDEGYQTIQSLYAISQGGLFGSGIGQSKQKNLYLPEPQNDFIYSIWCEELGFVGAMFVVLLFVLFTWRGIKIAKKIPNNYASSIVIGITIKVALQAILNMAVVTNVIPNTGVSLPFFSYGGTSLLFLMVEMGIVLSVSRYSYLEKS